MQHVTITVIANNKDDAAALAADEGVRLFGGAKVLKTERQPKN